MTDLLERLAAANPVRAADLAPSIEEIWRTLEDDPRPQPASRRLPRTVLRPQRRGVRRVAAVGVGVVTAGVAILVLGTTGNGPSNAFAGWTAAPTTPASGQTSTALDRCTSQLKLGRTQTAPSTAGGWEPVITDTRGPFTAMVLQTGGDSATCITGPSFTGTAQSHAGSQGTTQDTLMGRSAAGSGAPSVSAFGPGSGLISQASQTDLTTNNGQQYMFVQGQVAAGVTGVKLALADGSTVNATVGGRSFIAWWPGRATVNSGQVQNASGVSTQPLTFTRLPGPPTPQAKTSNTGPTSTSNTASPSS